MKGFNLFFWLIPASNRIDYLSKEVRKLFKEIQ